MTNERTSVENLKCKDPTFSRLLEKQKKTTSFSLTKRIVTLTESLKCQKLFHVLLPIQKVENYVLFRLGLGKTLPSTLGMPSFQKSAVFLNIVQKAFDPPPPFI